MHFGPLDDPNYGMPDGNVLLSTDAPDKDTARWNFVTNRGVIEQQLATVRYDGIHLRPISANRGIAIQGPDDPHPGYQVVIFD